MPTLSEGLKILIKGDIGGWTSALQTATSKGLAASKQLMSAFGDAFRQIRNYGVMAFGAISGVIGTSVKAAADFEKAFAEVTTLLDNVPQTGLTQLSDQIKEMAVQFGSSAATQARGMYEAISAGAESAADSTALLTAANKMAIGGVAELVPSLKLLATIVNAYGMSFQDAAHISDILFVAVKKGITTIPELAESFGRVSTLAATMKIPLEEVTAALAFLTLKGLDTSEAVTALRGVMTEILQPSERGKELLKELGIELNAERVATEGLMPSLLALAEATQGNVEATSTFFSNQRALIGVLGLSGSGMQKYNEILAEMSGSAGVAETAFAKMADTMSFRWAQMKAQLGNLLITIGEAFLPILEKVVAWITPIVTKVTQWIANNQELVAQIGVAAFAITGLVAGIGTLGAAIAPILVTIASLTTAFVGVMGAIGIGPLIVVGGGILAAIALVIAGTKDMDQALLTFINDPAKGAIEIFKAIKASIEDTAAMIKFAADIAIPSLSKAWHQFQYDLAMIVVDIGESIDWVITKISNLVTWVKDALSWLWRLPSPVEAVRDFMEPGFSQGGLVHRQSGGYIRGPAGIDSVPARLSAGEFVVNREAMAIYGPIVEAINNAGRGYARGGAVTINVSTPSISREFVRETLVPELQRAKLAGAY